MSTHRIALRERARLGDVLRGRAPLIGPRLGRGKTGLVSPIEARIALGLLYADGEREEEKALASRTRVGDLGLLARVALASLLPRPRGLRERRPFIVSSRVDPHTASSALDAIFAAPLGRRARRIHFVHPHALNVASREPTLRDRLATADVVLPDGFGIRLAAAILGIELGDNVNGTDLFPLLCARAASERRPLVFVGGAEGVAARAADAIRAAFPGLTIARTSHGFLDAPAIEALRRDIASLDRPIVLVGMGTPHQERFADEHLGDLAGATVVTVGGLFDFFSGRIPRAPMFLREMGLEWAYRLFREPRRLARRYLVGNPEFLARACRQRLNRLGSKE